MAQQTTQGHKQTALSNAYFASRKLRREREETEAQGFRPIADQADYEARITGLMATGLTREMAADMLDTAIKANS